MYISSQYPLGFCNVLETCQYSYGIRQAGDEYLVYAFPLSVCKTNKKVSYSIKNKDDNPVFLYAVTQKANELMAHTYSKLYNIPSIELCLLPFTV